MSATKNYNHDTIEAGLRDKTPFDLFIDLIIDCNIKLDNLRTKDYRFMAWIVYSIQHKAFIAGVDTYSNDEQNIQYIVTKAIGISPGDVIEQIHKTITKWHNLGEVPFDQPFE